MTCMPAGRAAAPWQDEAHAAAHGGLWRIAYAPRSALGLAALLGYRAARCSGEPDDRVGAGNGGGDRDLASLPR